MSFFKHWVKYPARFEDTINLYQYLIGLGLSTTFTSEDKKDDFDTMLKWKNCILLWCLMVWRQKFKISLQMMPYFSKIRLWLKKPKHTKGRVQKLNQLFSLNFPRRGYPPPLAENNYFFPPKIFYWLKMMYMLWNGFCMIWDIHLSIFWYLHEGENMWSWSASR